MWYPLLAILILISLFHQLARGDVIHMSGMILWPNFTLFVFVLGNVFVILIRSTTSKKKQWHRTSLWFGQNLLLCHKRQRRPSSNPTWCAGQYHDEDRDLHCCDNPKVLVFLLTHVASLFAIDLYLAFHTLPLRDDGILHEPLPFLLLNHCISC